MEQSLANMKLLTKNEVQGLKSQERTLEMQEGLKLAKKIDILRETASKEEAALAKFRVETLKVIQNDIVALSSEKYELERQVKELRDEKAKLRLTIESVKNY